MSQKDSSFIIWISISTMIRMTIEKICQESLTCDWSLVNKVTA